MDTGQRQKGQRGKKQIISSNDICRVSRSGQEGAFIDSICAVFVSCIQRKRAGESERSDPQQGLA